MQAPRIPPQKPPLSGSNFWVRNKIPLLGGVAVLALAAGGLTYRFVLRKPAASNAPIIEGPQYSQPPAPVPGSSATEPQSTGQPEQAPQTEPQEAAGEQGVGPASPAPVKSGRNSPRTTSAPAPPPYQEAHQNAEQALYASRLLDPPEDSALFWARKAKALGDPAAGPIEQQVYATEMASVQNARQAHDYTGAQTQLAQLTRYFPDRPELPQMATTLQQEQQKYAQQLEQQHRQAEVEAQTKHFQFRHRHVAPFLSNNGNNVSFCTGTLTVTPDGTVRYDCASSNDPQGRCDHVTFPPGSLREAKLKADGALHLASRQSGNFDFYGDANSVQQALAAIAPLVK